MRLESGDKKHCKGNGLDGKIENVIFLFGLDSAFSCTITTSVCERSNIDRLICEKQNV